MILIIFSMKEDITNRINNEMQEIERKNMLCLKEYEENQCHPEMRIPALEDFCNENEKCFSRNAVLEIGKTRTTVIILVEIINEIFEKLNWKSMLGLCLFYLCLINSFSFIIKIGKNLKA